MENRLPVEANTPEKLGAIFYAFQLLRPAYRVIIFSLFTKLGFYMMRNKLRLVREVDKVSLAWIMRSNYFPGSFQSFCRQQTGEIPSLMCCYRNQSTLAAKYLS